jgi:lipoprotein NlpI
MRVRQRGLVIVPRQDLGIVVRPELAPEDLADHARQAETDGFRELWLWEDARCPRAGGRGRVVLANRDAHVPLDYAQVATR